MSERVVTLLKILRWILKRNGERIVWNLFLAFIPLGLSFWLFRRGRSRSFTWWLVFVVFLAFLPNAPYILTDIVHLIYDIRDIKSVWAVTLMVFPLHLLFIVSGFEAYVLSLINLGYYLQRIGMGKMIVAAELAIHALCSVGIYLGRFPRYNSWDLLTKPDDLVDTVVEDLIGKIPLAIVFITFVIITILYWLFKQINIAVLWQRDAIAFYQPANKSITHQQ
ncbi:MAG: DUF1361 domain-containing protein [Chroococcus sp. CMT-3BRIN-NPC107]|jgi:uncharacterized membrane protein|nr:DUF1361 domain-containing protein [Chroococcus sp. CMT-3BRIN-NPC107]